MKRLALAAVVLGALLVAGGLYVGFQTVRRDDLICGRAFSSNGDGPVPDVAKMEREQGIDPNSDQGFIFYGDGKGDVECASSLSTHRVIALSTAIPGAVLIVAGVAVWIRDRKRPT